MIRNDEAVRISALADLADIEHVMVLTTASRHGRGVQRLPDRLDRGRRIAAVQVETDEQAASVLTGLDRPGRWLYLDVERKQDIHLMQVAQQVLQHSNVAPTKPNDITVDALQALLIHRIGADLSGLAITLYGTGNLAFKFALRFAESGCQVAMVGRNTKKLETIVGAINNILPAYTPYCVSSEPLASDSQVLIGAVTAQHVIDETWIKRLASKALCVDVGISNFSEAFIRSAVSQGHECLRLDVRSAGDPLPALPNPFFIDIAGRRQFSRATIVGGGLMGSFGEIVVDQITKPTRVVGIANGTGGLIPPDEWSVEAVQTLRRVQESVDESHRARQTFPPQERRV